MYFQRQVVLILSKGARGRRENKLKQGKALACTNLALALQRLTYGAIPTVI